uniref:Uncharacterized protein n=1 Tax=Rhizophora mucronata TaxID=61149 RepID=A0A2P2PU41_RHIMU
MGMDFKAFFIRTGCSARLEGVGEGGLVVTIWVGEHLIINEEAISRGRGVC